MRITKLKTEITNGVEEIKSNYLVVKDFDLNLNDSNRKDLLYLELAKLLNL